MSQVSVPLKIFVLFYSTLMALTAGAQQGGAANPIRSANENVRVIKITDIIYQAPGFGNSFMVTTDAGNVIIDTSLVTNAPKHKKILQEVNDGAVKYIILTHGHGDHTGGVELWREAGTEIIAQENQKELLNYQHRLRGLFSRRNRVQYDGATRDNWFDETTNEVENYGANLLATIYFNEEYKFELGGVQFELYHMPGETEDHLSVWLPQYKVAFIGDNFYGSFPNMYTLRGTKPRWALDYVDSINRILALKPELVIPSHGRPIKGYEAVEKALSRYRDAILYVHDETVKGMNLGKDVYTLMREIELPEDLKVSQGYGSIPWTVRGIYEGYVGWFDETPADMYPSPPSAVYADVVALAGGADKVAARADELIAAGDLVRGLQMAEMALSAAQTNAAALNARLRALNGLLERSTNSNESAWLRFAIKETQQKLKTQ